MKTIDSVGVQFVNTVVGSGILNGIINIAFGVCNFSPVDNGNGEIVIDPDIVIASRLRMDKMCAVHTRDVLNNLIAQLEQAEMMNNAPEPKQFEKTH
jgi:hypothetical protein